jgi:hypothetical protein
VRATARRPDPPTLAAGVALLVLGALVALDSRGAIDMSVGVLAPIALAAIGAVLLASGLSRSD